MPDKLVSETIFSVSSHIFWMDVNQRCKSGLSQWGNCERKREKRGYLTSGEWKEHIDSSSFLLQVSKCLTTCSKLPMTFLLIALQGSRFSPGWNRLGCFLWNCTCLSLLPEHVSIIPFSPFQAGYHYILAICAGTPPSLQWNSSKHVPPCLAPWTFVDATARSAL